MFKKYLQKNITGKAYTNGKLSPISINDETEDIFPRAVNVFSLMICLGNCFLCLLAWTICLFKLWQEMSEHEELGKSRKAML